MLDNYYVSFVNLDHRTDRLNHMTGELARINLTAERTRGMLPNEVQYEKPYRLDAMRLRTPGAIGCHFSQVSIWEKAKAMDKHAFVMEDDLIFCSDFWARIGLIKEWTDKNEWDVFWLGTTVHNNPPFWHPVGRSRMSPDCSSNLGRDAELTDNPRIIRTYGAFSTHCYLVNKNSIDKILALFEAHLHESIGIDWLFIKIQPKLKCYAFLPGLAKQMDNQSDIGTGITRWSGFLQLNGAIENSAYVWQDHMENFNPLTFNFHEWKR